MIPDITLNDGRTIPQLGFGVFQVPPPETRAAVETAIKIGYRHIDTAQMYGNESGVGEAIAGSGIDRAEFFITSKLNNGAHLPDDARRAFDGTLEALGTDYIDLFLIHWPLPTLYGGDFVQTWRALEELYRSGRARSIGVSNFTPHMLRRLRAETEIRPAVNQIEIHPFHQRGDTGVRLRQRDRERGLLADRAGRGTHRPDRRLGRSRGRQDAGPGRAALAHSARRHHLSQIQDRGSGTGELRALRF